MTKVTIAIWKDTKSTAPRRARVVFVFLLERFNFWKLAKKFPKVEVGKMFLLGDLRLSFSREKTDFSSENQSF